MILAITFLLNFGAAKAADVPQAFDANRDALRKLYRYAIHNDSAPDIFMRRYGQGPGILMVHTLSADQPDVAIPCAEACGQSHSNLRRLARLRSKWDTRFDG